MPRQSPPSQSPSPSQLPAYAIAFKEDMARRQQMTADFKPLGITLNFIDAIRGDSLSDATKKAFLNPARQYRIEHFLQDNAVGCAFCHYQAWQDMLNKNAPYALIFEDDALPNKKEIAHIAQRLHRLTLFSTCLDIVFFDTRRKNIPYIRLARLDAASTLGVVKYNSFGGYAYFITRHAARHLLTHPNRHIYEVDFHMHHWWRHRCQILYVAPDLFVHNDKKQSSIRYDRDRAWANDYFYHRLARRLNRMGDSLHKRLAFPHYVRQIRKRLAKGGLELC